ncbi:hypothetical protein [Nocardia huaxiensis]|uniref:Mce-associated membrane protein n=1 Tax=Nocardia huaxiensis TaxID=2755382 RepID=A0A7D6Z532_9NOCA|nr:hypothetical protein [Nocardia huaxiensis]QLY31544.1 hypothetical protein H0264_04165 [Nocardia huaxiensis]UFS95095.1 hypothetical protein LPY97_31000 [Nocardia huaxiensis]
MSETAANRSRTRRRVSRQAGPPAEDSAAVEIRESVAATVEPAPAEDAAAAPAVELVKDAPTAVDSAAKAEPEVVVDAEPETVAVPAAEPDAAADAAPAAEADGEEKPKSKLRNLFGSLGRSGTIAAAVALVSALVLLASGGVFFYHQNRADALETRRADYIQVAKQAYIDMTTIKDTTAGADIDRLLTVAGGSLENEYSQNRDLYKQIFEQLKVNSTGTVVAAAIETDDENSADVLLLAKQTISNTASNGPMQKDYRFRVHVQREGDSLSATSVELVP